MMATRILLNGCILAEANGEDPDEIGSKEEKGSDQVSRYILLMLEFSKSSRHKEHHPR